MNFNIKVCILYNFLILFNSILDIAAYKAQQKLEDWLSRQRFAPRVTQNFLYMYDYIVVGAGSGGATVAARLSEEKCVSVLLLEAGGLPPVLTEVPAFARNFLMSDIDWNDYTEPQSNTGNLLKNRKIHFPGGKVIGGSSVINAMLHVRGSRHIYDEWAAQGATGWSYEEVLPYFKKSEMNKNPEDIDSEYHGFDGPMTIETPKFQEPYKTASEQAAHELGYSIIDPNGRNRTGFFNYQSNIRDGKRCSVAKGYLVPADNRTNFHIVDQALVTKILIANKRAYGVRFVRAGRIRTVIARREIIVSAGTVRSAQLLMLSGIGPKNHLDEMRIPLVADLPVGNNLHDHIVVPSTFYSNEQTPSSLKVLNPATVLEYITKRSGILASSQFVMHMAFLPNDGSNDTDAIPDYEMYFVDAIASEMLKFNLEEQAYSQIFGPYEHSSLYWCLVQISHPKSRGTIRLKSRNPFVPPAIDPNYLSHPQDVYDVLQGLKTCDRVALSDSLKALGVKPLDSKYPGCEEFDRFSDEYLTCMIRGFTFTISHQVGTVKMGSVSDPSTVVDSELKVKGIRRLRVVDASIMPIVPTGNTNFPVIMIGEKAADMIKASFSCGNSRK